MDGKDLSGGVQKPGIKKALRCVGSGVEKRGLKPGGLQTWMIAGSKPFADLSKIL
jgi:hypothetical protein